MHMGGAESTGSGSEQGRPPLGLWINRELFLGGFLTLLVFLRTSPHYTSGWLFMSSVFMTWC